jgi:hypothetical protein
LSIKTSTMYRKSPTSTEPDLFRSFSQNLSGARYSKFSDTSHWHNVFREQIVTRIDEEPFRCLYSEDNGSPNASIRVLLGMMILKEGFGWSDSRLFEEAEFNILVMSGLGLMNMDDQAACPATYYNFRQALFNHQVSTGEDLIGNVFKGLTKEQAKFFGVNGKFTRMDSKLIGSNICKSSRLQLIINVLQVFYKDIKKKASLSAQQAGLTSRLTPEDLQTLEGLLKKNAGNQVYEMDNEERANKIEALGYLMYRLQELYNEAESEKYHLLPRVLSEQYHIEGGKVILRKVEEIKSDSLQSPYDEDAAYRKKGEGGDAQKVQGYSINVTETCNAGELNLITDTKVEKANYTDKDFLPDAIERSQQVVGPIEHVNADGAYHSEGNHEFAKANETELILSGMPGREGNYIFEITDEQHVMVTNTQTGEVQQAELSRQRKHSTGEPAYRIKENGKLRYFTRAAIHVWQQGQIVRQTPRSERNRRNNVEATIFQLSYFTRKNKTRYRNRIKHQWWADFRCSWLNLIRIKNWMGEVCPDENKNGESQRIALKNGEFVTNTVVFCIKRTLRSIQLFVECIVEDIFSATLLGNIPIKRPK